MEFLDQHFSTIERGLILLKSHLDSFCSRHSFQLRQWQLRNQESFDGMPEEGEETQTALFLSHLKLLKQMRVANNESASTLFKQINAIVNTLAERPAMEHSVNKEK